MCERPSERSDWPLYRMVGRGRPTIPAARVGGRVAARVWVLGPEQAGVRLVRRRVAAEATSWGVHEDNVRDAEVVTSELLTNALKHSDSPRVWLTLVRRRSTLVIAVLDQGPAPEGGLHARPLDDESTSGRGLWMVRLMSTRWGSRRYGRGTLVWALLRTDGSHDSGEMCAATEGSTDRSRPGNHPL